MSNQVVEIKRGVIAACMTCPLCNNLLKDATTISLCLHTFCRKCIHKKLSDEEVECCPICEIDLGVLPLEKLRPDHNLQDVRSKIFPYKRRKVDAPEAAPSLVLPARRKERTLSSLGVSTPRVSSQMTGRRSKVTSRKTSRGSSVSNEKQVNKEEDSESSSSHETLTKFTQNMKQNSTTAEPSTNPIQHKDTQNGVHAREGEEKIDLWKPLNFLVEVANRSKSSKLTLQGSASRSESTSIPPKTDGTSRKTKLRSKVQDGQDASDLDPSESLNPKKTRQMRHKKNTFDESGVSPQAVLDATSTRCERIKNPIWCSLVASEDQEGYEPLPQISASFLRIKDGTLPVSFLQKYLKKKLELPSEDEVEIICMGQPVVCTLQLHSLAELWLQTVSTSERISVTIGSSAKEFVMVLGYARKVSSHPHEVSSP
ncbi:E3 ubiquitin protein ligase DRIP2 [Heracleum sosnowskyi]|uniref:E3 ubiquitin protein ligase DRIP2 n=1 Tax=Heracleum sosnowskyi TaxID=360622 RepID=A0AAD8MHV6_9APIA|nr:E3 ubiquitin protein ligase DRIP2 [Heracleum sosnowskyi]